MAGVPDCSVPDSVRSNIFHLGLAKFAELFLQGTFGVVVVVANDTLFGGDVGHSHVEFLLFELIFCLNR